MDSQRADERCLRRTGTGRLSSGVLVSGSRQELGDLGLTFRPAVTFESLWGKEKNGELELISTRGRCDTLGLTGACTQLRGEGGRTGPGWTSLPSSQRLRAEICRDLELPETSEDRETTTFWTNM